MKTKNLLTTMALTLTLLLAGKVGWGQVNIIPIHTGNMADFPDWTYTDCGQSTAANKYFYMIKTTSVAITPVMDFSIYVNPTLDFKLRTYGGTNASANTVTVSISEDNGSSWTVLGTRTPTSSTLTPVTQFDLSSFTGTQIKIKFETLSATGSIGAGIDDIDIKGTIPDTQAPQATFNPLDAATNVEPTVTPTITFDEAIRNIDDSEITDANVASLLTLKETDASGADVPFTAAISADKKVITITPSSPLKFNQVYYLAIAPVEDESNNATTEKSITFTTRAASTDATVSSVVYTVDNLAETITNVPSSETLANFKANITPAAGATFEVYEADGSTVASDLQTGYKLICTAEDGTTQKIYTITLNTAVSNDATVSSTVYTVDNVAETITNVPWNETLATFKSNITPAAGATFEVYESDGSTVATYLQSGYKLTCTAEDGTTTKTYTITLNPHIEITYPNGGERFFAGDNVTITWTSANMGSETLKYEVWGRNWPTDTWEWKELAPAIPNTGSLDFTIPTTANYGTQYKIRLTGNTSGASDESDAAFTIIATPTIYDIQSNNTGGASNWANDSVRIGGIVTAVASKNYYLQAGTGAFSGIYVYYNTTHTYQVGDSLTVVGKVVEFNNLTELTTSKAATVVSSSNPVPAPAAVSTASANAEEYESVLIKVTGATCTASNTTTGNYTVNDGSGALAIYRSIFDPQLQLNRKYDITGVLGWYNTTSQFQLYPRTAADIYLYGNDAKLSDLKVDGVTVTGFDPATLTYDVVLPYGATTVPTVTYTLNDAKASAVKTDAAALPGTTTVKVTAEDQVVSQTYTINFTVAAPNTEANILTYTVAGVNATIDNGNHTVTATVPYTTDITNLVATFTLSDGATAKVGVVAQESGVTANDFTNPVTYTVTAQDGTTTQDWVVTITKAAEPNHEANITAYSINGVDGVINSGDHTISVTLPYGTNVTALVATFTISTNATAKVGGVDQVSGTTANDFTNPVTYTVTAEDGTTTQDWVVTVTVTPASSAKDITSFTISGQVSSTIDAVAGTVTVVMPYGTIVTALTPTIEVSEFATINPASGVAQDFTNPVVYTVTAQDASTKTWTVTVNVQPASNDATVSSMVYTVNNTDGTITNVPYNASLTTFKSNITPANGATFEVYQSDGTTVATDLQTGYKLICTAQDGTTTKTYTITLNTPPATPIVYEPFDYTVGSALQGQGGWTAFNTGDDLLIASGNLSYPDLAPSTGNKLSFAGIGIDAYNEFNASGIASGKVYYSFILKVTDLTAATEALGGYFIGFANDNTNFGATVWTKRVDDNSYQIGINSRTNTSTTMFTSSSYAKDAEVFIVASYEVVDGTGNDVAKIWINPASQDFGTANEPASTLSITNTGGTDLTSVKRIFIRQDSNTETPAIELDELRVGYTWAQVTPKGALSSNATVTSTVYTVDSNAGTITNVPQTETLANFKANITPAAGATFEVYQADGTTVATDLQTGYKLICTAEDGVTKKTYTITLNTSLSSENAILSYSINGVNSTIDAVNHTVTLTLPYGTNVTNLVATFTLSAAATAKVGATVQESGVTANDFTNPVTYTVTAEDGSTQDWVVTVNITAASTEKDILTFTIAGQVSSTIDAAAGTVTVVMPYGTNITSLTPTITVSQYATINPASGVAQDFTNPVTYTVTAQDNSTKVWTVTVTVQDISLISIYSIQYTTDASGDSPLKGQQVYTTGIVTAVKTGTTSFNIWIQDSAKAWNGVYVYGINNSMGTIVQGDSVEVIGTVDEFYNLTEVKTVTYLNKISSGNTLPTPVVVTPAEAATEAYEGVLVKLTNVECTVVDAGNGMFTVSDGTNTINIDDFLYKFTPTQGARYNITGVVDYGYGAFKVQPRSADDIESAEVTYTVTFTVKRADGTTPVADATITVTGQGNVTTDANGQATMQLPDGNYSYVVTKTGFDTNNGNFTVNGADLPVNITLIQTGIPANPIAKLNVYPNPFSDRIYFTGAEVTRVTITSVIGQVVLDRQVENAESIDVGSLDRGIYLVRFFNSKGETVLRKLVKE
jgi:hypothetical protein